MNMTTRKASLDRTKLRAAYRMEEEACTLERIAQSRAISQQHGDASAVAELSLIHI